MSQSRKHSMMEAILNVLIGFGVALAAQIVIFPLYGMHADLSANLQIGALFTVVSIVRSYYVRRMFNRWHINQQRVGTPSLRVEATGRN